MTTRPRRSPPPPLTVAFLGLLSLAGGCKSRCDLVEAELRTRENELYHLRGELHRSAACNDALQRENHFLHRSHPLPAPAELTAGVAGVKEVVLGRGTGGVDEDGACGDEALMVVVQPNDCDGQTIKAPGSLHVTALEINPEGFKRALSAWDLSPAQLRKTYKSGLISTGYHVTLPWKVWPTTTKLRVVVQFLLPDGRAFEAEKDVTVKVAPASLRPPAPPGPPRTVADPDGDTPLDAPRKVEPGPVMPEATARQGGRDHTTAWRYRRPAAELLPPVPGW
jgi:hypothetical protein